MAQRAFFWGKRAWKGTLVAGAGSSGERRQRDLCSSPLQQTFLSAWLSFVRQGIQKIRLGLLFLGKKTSHLQKNSLLAVLEAFLCGTKHFKWPSNPGWFVRWVVSHRHPGARMLCGWAEQCWNRRTVFWPKNKNQPLQHWKPFPESSAGRGRSVVSDRCKHWKRKEGNFTVFG